MDVPDVSLTDEADEIYDQPLAKRARNTSKNTSNTRGKGVSRGRKSSTSTRGMRQPLPLLLLNNNSTGNVVPPNQTTNR